jgi:acetyl esterase/lipase
LYHTFIDLTTIETRPPAHAYAEELGHPASGAARRLVWLLRWTFRPLGSLTTRGPAAPAMVRAVLRMTPFIAPARSGTQVRAASEGVPGDWIRARGVTSTDCAILYAHGGGFVACSPRTHRGLAAELSGRTGMPVFLPRYRRAPEHRFPCAVDDLLTAYEQLLARDELAAERIVLAGDSAGGNLVLSAMLAARDGGLPLPAAQVLLSPVVDLTLEQSRTRDRHSPDPLMNAASARRVVALYTHGADLDDPRLKPLAADFADLPPTLIQVGTTEMLLADSRQLAQCLHRAGSVVKLEEWQGQVHVFQAHYRALPEAREALDRAARFIGDALGSRLASVPA